MYISCKYNGLIMFKIYTSTIIKRTLCINIGGILRAFNKSLYDDV